MANFNPSTASETDIASANSTQIGIPLIKKDNPEGQKEIVAGLTGFIQRIVNSLGSAATAAVTDFASSSGFAAHVSATGNGSHIPATGLTNTNIASDAAIGWTKISKSGATPEEIGAQPLDSDLTTIAALTTTAYGRNFLEIADELSARSKIGFNEAVDDRIDAVLLTGGGISKTYNDAANTLTISLSYVAKVDVSNSKTFAASDFSTYQNCTNASDITLTIPTDTTLGLSTTSQAVEITVARNGSGAVGLAPISGVTLRGGTVTLAIASQWSAVTLKRIGANNWTVHGDV